MKKIIIVGAGPGGLSAALLLSSRGFEVEVFEKSDRPGGRNSYIQVGDHKFDIGPTFLMMKFILDEIFQEAGLKVTDYLKFYKIDPMYRLLYADKEFFPTNDADNIKKEIAKHFPGLENGYDMFMQQEKKRFEKMMPCLQKSYSDLSSLFSPDLLKAIPYLGIGRSVFDVLTSYFKNEDLALAFSFQTKYLGMSAWRCPAAFSMLSYIEHAYGIYHVEGGLSSISEAMEKAAIDKGVKINYNIEIKQIVSKGNNVTGVLSANGEEYLADEIVLNADFGYAMTNFFRDRKLKKYNQKKMEKLKFSCSTFMIYLGLDKIYDIPFHNIVFAENYQENVRNIFEVNKISDDNSFYVRNASILDSTLSPEGKSGLYVLVPVPNLRADINWLDIKTEFKDKIIATIKKRLALEDLEESIEVVEIITPIDWQDKYNVYEGATFNLTHNIGQMAYLRPHNRFEELNNCFLVGGGTHPGSGLPTIYESGRIAANMISRKYGIEFKSKNIEV